MDLDGGKGGGWDVNFVKSINVQRRGNWDVFRYILCLFSKRKFEGAGKKIIITFYLCFFSLPSGQSQRLQK